VRMVCGWLNILTFISLFYFNLVLITNNQQIATDSYYLLLDQ